MAKYFTINELTKSETADRLKIDNKPDETVEKNLNELADTLLDPLREAWGSGISVNSGYRSPELNKAVKGSKTSSHVYGLAADVRPSNGKMEEFKEFVYKWLDGKDFDQYIDEHSGKSEWVHLSHKNVRGEQRKQKLLYKGGKYSFI